MAFLVLLSRKNRGTARAIMLAFGRVVTEVNAVKVRTKAIFSGKNLQKSVTLHLEIVLNVCTMLSELCFEYHHVRQLQEIVV